MDWMTLSIELIGALILCLWIIIPIGEYRTIYQQLRGQRHTSPQPSPERRGSEGEPRP